MIGAMPGRSLHDRRNSALGHDYFMITTLPT